jgi:RimJ/RimL family protein N-acetyltransferase
MKVRQMVWQVLDWNEPAIRFYKKFNAELDPEWINGKLRFELNV